MLIRSDHAEHGVSLIETVIVMAIVAIVLMFGVPGFSEWSQNTQIRATAESIQSGLHTARAEAVRRNVRVEFRLSDNLASEGGTGWSIWTVNPSQPIQNKPDAEGSYRIRVTTPNNNATDRVTFDGSGRTPAGTTTNADGSAFMTQIDVTSPATTSPRNLRLVLSLGGMVRICDPNSNISANDLRKCP